MKSLIAIAAAALLPLTACENQPTTQPDPAKTTPNSNPTANATETSTAKTAAFELGRVP